MPPVILRFCVQPTFPARQVASLAAVRNAAILAICEAASVSTLLSSTGSSGDLVSVSRQRPAIDAPAEWDAADVALTHERAVLRGMNLTPLEESFATAVGQYMQSGEVTNQAEIEAREWALAAVRSARDPGYVSLGDAAEEVAPFELRDLIAAISQLASSAPPSPSELSMASSHARVDPAVASAIAAALHELEPDRQTRATFGGGGGPVAAALRSPRSAAAAAAASATAYAQLAVPKHIAHVVDAAAGSASAARAAVDAVLRWLTKSEAVLQLGLAEEIQQITNELHGNAGGTVSRSFQGMPTPDVHSDPFAEFEGALVSLAAVDAGVDDASAAIASAAAYMRRERLQARKRRAAFRAARRSRIVLVAAERACAVHERRLQSLRDQLAGGGSSGAPVLERGTNAEQVVRRAIENAAALTSSAQGSVAALSLSVSSTTASLLLQDASGQVSSAADSLDSHSLAPSQEERQPADYAVVTQVATAAHAVRVVSEVLHAETARVRASAANSVAAYNVERTVLARRPNATPMPLASEPQTHQNADRFSAAHAKSAISHERSIAHASRIDSTTSSTLRHALAAFVHGGSSLSHRHYFPSAAGPGPFSVQPALGGGSVHDCNGAEGISGLDSCSAPASAPGSTVAARSRTLGSNNNPDSDVSHGPLLTQKIAQLSVARNALLRSVQALVAEQAPSADARGTTSLEGDEPSSSNGDELIASPKLLPGAPVGVEGNGVPRSLARMLHFVEAASAAAAVSDPSRPSDVQHQVSSHPSQLTRGPLVGSDAQSALIAARLRRFRGRRESLASADDVEDDDEGGSGDLPADVKSQGCVSDDGSRPAAINTSHPPVPPRRSSTSSGRSPHPHVHGKPLPVAEAGLSPAAEAHPREPRAFLLSVLERRGTASDDMSQPLVAATPEGDFGPMRDQNRDASLSQPSIHIPQPRRTFIVQAAGRGRAPASAAPSRGRQQHPLPRSVSSTTSRHLQSPPLVDQDAVLPYASSPSPADQGHDDAQLELLHLRERAPLDDASLTPDEVKEAAAGLGDLIDAAVRRYVFVSTCVLGCSRSCFLPRTCRAVEGRARARAAELGLRRSLTPPPLPPPLPRAARYSPPLAAPPPSFVPAVGTRSAGAPVRSAPRAGTRTHAASAALSTSMSSGGAASSGFVKRWVVVPTPQRRPARGTPASGGGNNVSMPAQPAPVQQQPFASSSTLQQPPSARAFGGFLRQNN